jgi:hypothetical protein
MNVNIITKGTFAVIVIAFLCGTYLISISDYNPEVDLFRQMKVLVGVCLIAFGAIAFFLVPWSSRKIIRKYAYQ